MTYQTRYELVDTIYKHAIAALVAAVVGQKLSREPYSEPIKDAARNLVKAFKAGAVYKDNYLGSLTRKPTTPSRR